MGRTAFMIHLKNLVIGYEKQPLVKEMNGCFQSGSLTAVMGLNGTGKSTLLRTIAQVQKPLEGHIHFPGFKEMTMSWLPQLAEVDRSFPIQVMDVVSMGCWPKLSLFRALKATHCHRVHLAMEQVGILDLANKTIDQLSGGQFQRMLFARMLVENSDVMLMDEPFVGIDTKTRDVLLNLIMELHQAGKTIIAVLHQTDIVHRYFSDLLLLKEEDVLWGKTEKILPHFHDSFRWAEPHLMVNEKIKLSIVEA